MSHNNDSSNLPHRDISEKGESKKSDINMIEYITNSTNVNEGIIYYHIIPSS